MSVWFKRISYTDTNGVGSVSTLAHMASFCRASAVIPQSGTCIVIDLCIVHERADARALGLVPAQQIPGQSTQRVIAASSQRTARTLPCLRAPASRLMRSLACRWHTFIKTCPRPPAPAAERFAYLDHLDGGTLAWLEAELTGDAFAVAYAANEQRMGY